MKRESQRSFLESFPITGRDFLAAGKVSAEIKSLLKDLGVEAGIIRRIAIATYEAEMNVVMYATTATVTLEMTSKLVKIVVSDCGPGIPDVELAMQEGFSTATPEMRELGFGAGMGLPNIKKNADDFRIESVVGQGTRLEISVNIG